MNSQKGFSLSILFLLLSLSCSRQPSGTTLAELTKDSPSIQGKSEYLASPYLTAGDRLYMVGHQDGSFPDLGWHVKGEMGGIWLHPIKLMDGFEMTVKADGKETLLNKAEAFYNLPYANKHLYTLADEGLKIERWQFVPDGKAGISIQYSLENTNERDINIQLRFKGNTDLMPVWLGERTGMIDGRDEARYLQERGAWLVKDEQNPWFVVFGAGIPPTNEETLDYPGNGVANALDYEITLKAGETKVIDFTIAGSYNSEDEVLKMHSDIQQNLKTYVLEKKERYKELAGMSKLSIPDEELEQTFEWLKYNCDWLVRTVPEIGTGISAGIPDYPWWFGVDSEYSLRGYMAIGQTEPVFRTIQLLDSVSNAVNGNGRIIHEMSTNGAVFNEGNINETPQFASLIWEIYLWHGDEKFLQQYFPTIQKGLSWLMEENDANQNLFPDGFGMMEIHGLDSEMIDVAAYTQRAFEDASRIAAELKETALASKYAQTAEELKERINSEFWSEDFSSFADFIGTDEQALHLIEDAIVRADTLGKPWAVEELEKTRDAIIRNPSTEERPFVLHHNWVVNTPMEMGIADEDKAERALETAEKFVNPFGVFVTGIDRDESAGTDDGSFQGSKVFSYTGAVMTLPTGVQAIAENNYGRPDKALDYLKRMTRSFSYALPGSMYEVSPDYGMMAQAWNIYSYAVPIVQQFFGFKPRAQEKLVQIMPSMPSAWGEASLENIKVGDNQVSLYYSAGSGKKEMIIEQENPNWTMELVLPATDQITYKVIKGEAEIARNGSTISFSSKGKELGISVGD